MTKIKNITLELKEHLI